MRSPSDRVAISGATIQIHLSEVADGSDGARILTLPWTLPSPYRKREIIQGADDGKTRVRPTPANARPILIEALLEARRWLDELLSYPRLTLESQASAQPDGHGKNERRAKLVAEITYLPSRDFGVSNWPERRALAEAVTILNGPG